VILRFLTQANCGNIFPSHCNVPFQDDSLRFESKFPTPLSDLFPYCSNQAPFHNLPSTRNTCRLSQALHFSFANYICAQAPIKENHEIAAKNEIEESHHKEALLYFSESSLTVHLYSDHR